MLLPMLFNAGAFTTTCCQKILEGKFEHAIYDKENPPMNLEETRCLGVRLNQAEREHGLMLTELEQVPHCSLCRG